MTPRLDHDPVGAPTQVNGRTLASGRDGQLRAAQATGRVGGGPERRYLAGPGKPLAWLLPRLHQALAAAAVPEARTEAAADRAAITANERQDTQRGEDCNEPGAVRDLNPRRRFKGRRRPPEATATQPDKTTQLHARLKQHPGLIPPVSAEDPVLPTGITKQAREQVTAFDTFKRTLHPTDTDKHLQELRAIVDGSQPAKTHTAAAHLIISLLPDERS